MNPSPLQGRAANWVRRAPTYLAAPTVMGFALGLYGAATLQRSENLLHPCTSMAPTVALAILAAILIGTWLPNRYARLFARLTRRGPGGDNHDPAQHPARHPAHPLHAAEKPGTPPTEDHRQQHISDAQLRTAGSACLVLAGLSLIALNAVNHLFADSYERLVEGFHWTPLTLPLLDAHVVLAYVAVPMILWGVAVNCCQRNILLRGPRFGGALAAVLLGLALGLSTWVAVQPHPPRVVTMFAAVLLLATGLVNMRSAPPSVFERGDWMELPVMSWRWHTMLGGMLVLTGFMCTHYVQLWRQICLPGGSWPQMHLQILLLAVGVWSSHVAYERLLRPLRNLALLYIVTAIVLTLTVMLAGHAGWIVETAAPNSAPTIWNVGGLSAPCLILGLALGSTMSALVERRHHAASSILSAIAATGIGGLLSCAAAMLGWTGSAAPLQQFVIMILMWLALGGLLLIYEPHFVAGARLTRIAVIMAALGWCCLVLPAQVPRWSTQMQALAQSTTGRLEMLTHIYRPPTRRMHDATEANLLWAEWAAIREAQNHKNSHVLSVDRMTQEVRLSKERYAAVILVAPPHAGDSASEKLLATLLAALRARLRPDAVLIVRFNGSADIRLWQEQAMKDFEHTGVVSLAMSGSDDTPSRYLLASPTRPTEWLLRREPPGPAHLPEILTAPAQPLPQIQH